MTQPFSTVTTISPLWLPKELGVNIDRVYDPPRIFTRMSLMKSVFVHKKHFHQYEMRTMFKVFEIKHITGSTASTFLEYIQRNLPEGLAMKVTKVQIEPFPSHLQPPESTSKTKKVESSHHSAQN
ncbi:28S ribosomal protein S10, mitochondrial [Bulinus truncatus]|nr:28S ribosomal protein S10, mitochondrial [Bulinus truncatus]